jgi:hypothetical protein
MVKKAIALNEDVELGQAKVRIIIDTAADPTVH